MRAKFKVTNVVVANNADQSQETVTFAAVGPNTTYPADGSDENNTFAKFTPTADLVMVIRNPTLLGKYQVGQTHYADFTPAD